MQGLDSKRIRANFVGLTSYYSLKECFEKLTDLNFDDYVTVANECDEMVIYPLTRFVIFDRISQEIGHWCVYDYKNKLYYDPFGFLPPEFFDNDVLFNTKREQHINSSSCGYYCIKWIFLNMNHKLDTSSYKKIDDEMNEYEYNNLINLCECYPNN